MSTAFYASGHVKYIITMILYAILFITYSHIYIDICTTYKTLITITSYVAILYILEY